MIMASKTVFIAYAHKDWRLKDQVSTHLNVLASDLNLDVWSDTDIGAGEDWLEKIETAISKSSLAILLISQNFLTSDFINQKEVPALLKRKLNDKLPIIPILVRDCSWTNVSWLAKMQMRPFGAKAIANITTPKRDAELAKISDEISVVLKEQKSTKVKTVGTNPSKTKDVSHSTTPTETASAHVSRLSSLPIGGLPLPCFFPSVSGAAKSNFSPLDHLKILTKLGHPCFLASAYDFVKISPSEKIERDERLEMLSLIGQASQSGQVILLDSGLYERKWLHDMTWSRQRFHSALNGIRCHLGFFFDNIKIKVSSSLRENASEICDKVRKDRRAAGLEALFPIVHPRKSGEPETLPELCRLVAQDLDSDIIAVAERELGEGILEGAKTMVALRRALNETGRYRVIHLLGTGNPLSILIYAACGADSFDGLDWCQTVVNFEDKRLYHNQQIDFFKGQTIYADSGELGHPTRMLAHNLQFYEEWMKTIQEHIMADKLDVLLKEFLPKTFHDELILLLNSSDTGKS